MVYCPIDKVELEVSNIDGKREFRCPICKSVVKSKESGTDIEVYNLEMKKTRYEQYADGIEYAGNTISKIRQITISLRLAQDLGLESAEKLEKMLVKKDSNFKKKKKKKKYSVNLWNSNVK